MKNKKIKKKKIINPDMGWDRKTEEILILGCLALLLVLSILTLNKVLPESFQSMTGQTISMVNITQPLIVNCNFSLESGLNLVSFFCITNMHPRDIVLSQLSNLEAVWEYQEGESDAWKSYNPDLPSFVVQDLSSMSRTEGYWIKMSSQEDYFLEGGLRLPTNTYLVAGWNLAGYPTNETKEINQSLSSIYGNYTEVRSYNASTGSYTSYVPGIGGTINQTQAYQAYWINATTSEVWTVD